MKEKTKKLVKRLSIIGGAIVSVLIVLAIVLSLTACSLKNSEQENGANAYPNVNAQLGLGPNVLFTFSETTVNEETNSVSKTITATVLPEDAPDKSVDWSIAWNENNEGDDAVLSDYISITPLEDGSNVATVTCYKGFEGSTFMIWVKTRVGGYQSNCLVKYDGKPETFYIIHEGVEYSGVTSLLTLKAGETYNFDLKLSNTLGEVGSKYGDFEIVDISGSGKFVATKKIYNNMNVVSSSDIVVDLSQETLGTEGEVDYAKMNYNGIFYSWIFETGHELDVTVRNNMAGFYINTYINNDNLGTGVEYAFKEPLKISGSEEYYSCSYNITLKEKNSNVFFYFRFKIDSTVSSVSLDASEITF